MRTKACTQEPAHVGKDTFVYISGDTWVTLDAIESLDSGPSGKSTIVRTKAGREYRAPVTPMQFLSRLAEVM